MRNAREKRRYAIGAYGLMREKRKLCTDCVRVIRQKEIFRTGENVRGPLHQAVMTLCQKKKGTSTEVLHQEQEQRHRVLASYRLRFSASDGVRRLYSQFGL